MNNHSNPSEESGNENNDKKKLTKKEFVEEYRLIPVDEVSYKDDEDFIDVVGLLKDLWMNRRTIYLVAGVIFIIGLFYYYSSEKIYYSEAVLMPETTSNRSQLGQVFQQYESIFGIQRSPAEDDLRVSMYPDIVMSLPFQIELMQHQIYFSDIGRQVTIFEYFTEHYKKSLIDRFSEFVWDFTIGLPSKLWGFLQLLFSDHEPERLPVNFSDLRNFDRPLMLNPEVRSVAQTVSGYITVTREPQSGFISIGVSHPDAHASAAMVIIVKNLLQEYVTDYRTEKSINDLEFIRLQFQNAKTNLLIAQDSLAAFQDRNFNIQSHALILRQERLQTERDLAFSLYSTLARQLQEAEIQVQKETPVFRVHEPATIPTRPAHPRATRILGGSVFAGLFLGVIFIYLRRAIYWFRTEFHNKEPKPYLSRV
ncbi:MAG: hypothetical protein EA359_09755 [Balneolaceae bacterium]|nr:MAG: hypothetical protein EA359_09755 [Balneolaceae bacterium]